MKPAKELAITAAADDTGRVRAMLEQAPELARDWQPIMDACFWGRAEVVRLLLDRGADPNVMSKSTHRYRPLHRTVEHKVSVPRGPEHLEVVKILIEGGADVMARGCWNMVTPVALAAMGGEMQFLPLLLASVPERDIFMAAVLGNVERVSALLQQDPALARAADENGWQALRYCAASRVGQTDAGASVAALWDIARELLRHGADPAPALGPAIGTNNAPLVEMLLAHGAVLDDGDALVHTAEAGNFAVLEILAQHGVDLQCTRGTEHHGGYTPLGCLMTIRSARGAKWFLEHGIDPNHIGGDRGETALHVAVRYGCAPETLRMLAEFGVDLNARDQSGQTALAVARAQQKTKAAEFLKQAGASE